MSIKLGQKVSFTKELKKVTDGSGYISEESMKEQELEMKWLNKHKEFHHREPKLGIVVGKRRIADKTLVEFVEGTTWIVGLETNDLAPIGSGEYDLHATESEFINVYLVATNLRGFHRVRLEDLEIVT